eukprot:CAMPEP_0168405656 /NCGR_PEP_ID=MMETSP0228-20121227/25251_1 /TAXON_ID=133427 /ORGANISM="Protoceratium reticulatum, Strain CCCM 535 (=CCMP 1889)" /LENGTH=441 /DNA_ID=CAMNT_0008419285 /DNA_START=72 /DNA_END=1397 /DNA_ORIENTATION=-
MDEPLLCWVFLLLAMIWGSKTRSKATQDWLRARFGMWAPLFQWYNVTFILLGAIFLRTILDIFFFEYHKDSLLSWDKYKDDLDPQKTNIPLTPEEMNFDTGPLVMPSFIRWISLASPLFGIAAFAMAGFQVIRHVFTPSNDAGKGEQFLHMVVVGMPLVFIVMSLRATIRQWAIMTGSAWYPYRNASLPLAERQDLWTEIKAQELSTYHQDLEVASGFQFFAVWCFGQVCSASLTQMVGDDSRMQDKQVLIQLGILGLHAFVVLGVLKTIVNVIVAMFSANPALEAMLEPIQEQFLSTIDPIFIFATILSVVNMFLLGKIKAVRDEIPDLNSKFNATRLLLLIGQGQFTVLKMATTNGIGQGKLLKIVRKLPLPIFKHLTWWFGMNQARLLHSSLLCFECLIIVIVNYKMWHANVDTGLQEMLRTDMESVKDKLKPLLPCK